MADVQEVLIDFKVDYSELTNAQEQLSKGGKIDASQFKAVRDAISTTATDTKGLIQQFKTVATTATKMGKTVENAFGAGVQDALDEAGVSVKEFSDALTKANTPTKTLKQELRQLTEALARMKAEGKDTGAEFEALRARAGKLSDAIGDAGREIKNAGSDTRGLDNVVGSVSALAGGFAAAQGAAALFGNENEDVQKALLKVNGAMALATGIQQFYNATLKEGALVKLADSVATGVQSAAQTIYTVAVGASTGALRVFRIALLATGIGAIIALLVIAADAMGVFGKSTGETTKSLEDQKEAADALVNSLNDIADAAANARAGQAGGSDEIKRQIELAKAKGKNTKEVFDLEQKLRQQEIRELRILGETYSQEFDARKKLGTLTEADAEALNNKIVEINRKGRDKRNEINAAEISFIREQGEQRVKDAKEAADKLRAQRLADLKDTLAFLERDLLVAEKGSAVELDLKKKVIRQKAKIELEAEKLTGSQVLLIKAQSLQAQLDLQKEFNATATKQQLQSQIDTNAAILAGIGINNEERLRLQIENINTTAQLEINAAQGNAAKVLLIEAKKLSDIRALKLAAIDKERADQISESQQANDVIRGALEKVSADQKLQAEVRIAAIRGIEKQELLANQNAIDDNERKHKEMLISDEEYYRKRKELVNKQANIERKADDEAAAVHKASLGKKIEDFVENNRQIINQTLEVAGQVAEFYDNLSSLATEQERQRIDQQKQQLQSLIDAGAITTKQAKIRAQEIEIAEKRARQRAAQREKQAAIFRALLAIPQAFLKGLTDGGIYLAAIYGALAAVEAAIVINRPVPKFFRGKRDNYAGPGEVADMGSEIVERGGRMFLYTKPTKTYLGATDKVYTASQTRQILHNTNVNTTVKQGTGREIDYVKLAASFPKQAGVNVNIEKDFISEAVANGLSKNNYFTNRYNFKR